MPGMASSRRFWEKYGWLAILLALLLVWESAYRFGMFAQMEKTISAPSRAAGALLANLYDKDFLAMAGTSYLDVMAGMFIALLAALPLGIVNGAIKKMDLSTTPLFLLLGSLPVLAILPLMVFWFGRGAMPAMLMSAIAAFFPIYFNVREGMMSIPVEFFETMKVFGAERVQTLHKLVLPWVWPYLFTGLRLSFQYIWEIILAIEIVAAVPGLGMYIQCQALPAACGLASTAANIDNALAGVLAVAIMVLATDRIVFEKFEEDIARWKG